MNEAEESKILAFAAEKGVDPEVVRNQLRALRSQTYNEDVMYYSRIRMYGNVTTAVGPPIVSTITFTPFELYAFGYAVAGPVQQGGSPIAAPQVNATQADTNLVKAGETNGGERLIVKGISCRLGALSDTLLWALMSDKMSLRIRMQNKDRYLIGAAADIPQLNALPNGFTQWITPPSDSKWQNWTPPQAQSLLYATGYMPFARPIIWEPSGKTDSNLTVAVQLHESVSINSTERLSDELCPCLVPWSPPQENFQPGAYVDLWVRLHGTLSAGRSPNE